MFYISHRKILKSIVWYQKHVLYLHKYRQNHFLCAAFCLVTERSSRIIYPQSRYITSNLPSQIAMRVHKFSHTHKRDSYTHSESSLCGPAGSPARLIGTVLQPGGGGWLGGVMDGEWPGQSVFVCVFVTAGICLCVLTL